MNTSPPWFEAMIARGLQGLVALRLPGSPAEDSITMTLDVWLAALQGNWDEQQDSWRIIKAFRVLYGTCDRWPAPKVFVACLPRRKPLDALPPPKISTEQMERNKERVRELRKKLASMYAVRKN